MTIEQLRRMPHKVKPALVSYKRVGGIRFLRVHRFTLTLSIAKGV